MARFALLQLITLFFSGNAFAQRIDNTLLYRQPASSRYVRICYDNDFFTATDKYYTQGIDIELVAQWVRRLPSSRLLLRPFHHIAQYGISIQHNAYTPTDIAKSAILYGDRPFAACLFVTNSVVTSDTMRKARCSSSVSAGVIGPAAGGMEMQTAIHRWLHDITPHGWVNQVRNDLILNYQLGYEKQLLSCSQILLLTGNAVVNAGTLSGKLSVGSTIMAGHFISPFGGNSAAHLSLYLYDHPAINAVAYDATLEGGMLNHNSPYSINPADVTPFTFQNNAGIVICCRNLYIEYGYAYLSREFSTGGNHSWGCLQITIGF